MTVTPTTAPPANAQFGTVHGRFIVGVADGADADLNPDYVPAQGEILFTPSVPYVPNPGAPGGPVTMLKTSIRAVLDAEGYLCTANPDGTPGARGLKLLATDDENMLVTGWTWNVGYYFDSIGMTPLKVETHGIAVPGGADVDLTTTLKVPATQGYGIPQAEAAALRAEALLNDTAGIVAEQALGRIGEAGLVTEARLTEALADFEPGDSLPTGGTAGEVLTKTATGEAWAAPPTGIPDGGSTGQALMRTATGVGWGTPQAAAMWDADKLAIARGFHEVVSTTEPTVTSYTASNGETYPVVWLKPITNTVPVLPQAPAFSRASSSLSVPELVGVVYRLTGWSKDNGATWTTISKDLVGGAVTDVKTAIGQTLPVTVRVEAFAKPGYTLPTSFKWTFDYPDPNATVIATSDAFTGADTTSVIGRMSDATLGGTSMQWRDVSTSPAVKVSGGRLVTTGVTGGADLSVGAFNMEAEFDLVRTDGQAGAIGLSQISLRVGSNGNWNNGFGFDAGRVYENGNYITDANSSYYKGPAPAGLGALGHYVMSVIGQTGRITTPTGAVFTATLDAIRTSNQTRFMVQANAQSAPYAGIDNLVVKQVGY